ncbi:uncharacterized protein LOC110103352 [Dendrobium catenatum]|uniref:uncharacterized protein LOC110103352 n=1 Tax=Dendrobium catenatum TaxID=906689 RepID=UPI0009F2AAC1|nr:uncharacterized protein LOC110103352 [Dendrobium catenatum]
MESVLNSGPWYVNESIIGIDKWSPNFDPSSLKGLTASVWIRLPNLPLQSWDRVNVCRIASMVGKPFLIDENMFQWGRREYARVCVKINLDDKLEQGVWVEGAMGKFFQKICYERIPHICFKYGKVGHVEKNCGIVSFETGPSHGESQVAKEDGELNVFRSNSNMVKNLHSNVNREGYGPWIHVDYGKRRRKINNFQNTWRTIPIQDNKTKAAKEVIKTQNGDSNNSLLPVTKYQTEGKCVDR